MNIGRPKLKDDSARDLFPLVLRWKGKQNAVTVKSDIVFYRNALNSLKTCDVSWRCMWNLNLVYCLESNAFSHTPICCLVVQLTSWYVVACGVGGLASLQVH